MESVKVNELTPVIKTLRRLGYKTTKPRHKNSNGVDIFAIKNNYVLSVEIKLAIKPKGKNTYRIRGVEHNRKNDDLIAILFPSGYVLLEPMEDHLSCCNSQGDRFINY